MSTPFVHYERKGAIAYITFDRPDKLNALTDGMVLELKEHLYAFDEDREAQVAILNGTGRAFCSGADVKQRHLRPKEELERLGSAQGRDSHVEDLWYRTNNWKPVIAAVHGYALGAGLYLALSSDLLVAAEGTQFQITETSKGVDGTHYWALLRARTVGGFAGDVGITGRYWTAEEAFKYGGIDRLAKPGKHLEVAEELAASIMRNPPLSVRGMVEQRRLMNEEVELRARLSRPRRLYLTDDFREATMAFVEKRKPTFKGR